MLSSVRLIPINAPPMKEGETVIDFKLIYTGPLPSASRFGRVEEKHRIRQDIHRQLRYFWENYSPDRYLSEALGFTIGAEAIATRFRINGYRFVPLVREEHVASVAVDILFMRRDKPGRIVSGGGDIDNRLKTLFDALRMPIDGHQLPPDSSPSEGEDPFFVLLQDDSLITDIRVTTSPLLEPAGEQNNVHLVIGVSIVPSLASFSETIQKRGA